MAIKYVIWSLHLWKINCCSFNFRGFTDCMTGKANGWYLWWVAGTRISVIKINFDQGKCNLVWIRIRVIRVQVIKVNFDQGKCNLVWIRIPVIRVWVIQVQVTKK